MKIVRKANTGVRRHGVSATVLSKMGSAKEEGIHVPGVMMRGQRVDGKEVWEVWVLENADREGFLR